MSPIATDLSGASTAAEPERAWDAHQAGVAAALLIDRWRFRPRLPGHGTTSPRNYRSPIGP